MKLIDADEIVYESIDSSDTDEYFAKHGTGILAVRKEDIDKMPPAEPKRGKWIQDRSGAYCCSECMEPCATYVMMRPRDKFCKMCGSRNEVTE